MATDTKNSKLIQDLLKQAIESGDPDLIKLAQAAMKKKTPAKKGRPRKSDEIEGNTSKKKGRVGFDGNLFKAEDYAREFRNETEWAKRLTEYKVSERRPEVKFIDISCSKCQRVESLPETAPIFASDSRYYVCTKCGVH